MERCSGPLQQRYKVSGLSRAAGRRGRPGDDVVARAEVPPGGLVDHQARLQGGGDGMGGVEGQARHVVSIELQRPGHLS